MKRLAFTVFLAASIAASPTVGQSLGTTPGMDFVDAVRKSDGDKAIQILSTHPPGLIDTRGNDGNTALLLAIGRGDETWTGYLLNKGANPNLPGKGGDTPLIAATRVGFGDAVDWLLGLGAKVDGANRMGETPLIIAVQQREPAIVRKLLDAGANPDKTDAAAGYSARDYATRDPRARDMLKMIDDKKPKTAITPAK